MLRAGSAVATRRKAPPPSGYLVQAAIELAVAGVLTDPQAYVTQIRAHLNQDHDEDEASTSSPA